MTYKATPAQKEAATRRREAFKAVCDKVAAMTEEERARIAGAAMIATCDGHVLSFHNQCLLLAQTEGRASIVGGFHQWRTQGRTVRKGEHGLMIWAKTQEREKEGPASTGEKKESYGFIPVTVFDITQTDPLETPVSGHPAHRQD